MSLIHLYIVHENSMAIITSYCKESILVPRWDVVLQTSKTTSPSINRYSNRWRVIEVLLHVIASFIFAEWVKYLRSN